MVRSENIELSIKVPSFCYLEGAGGQVISWRFPSNFQLGVEKKSGKMMRLRCTFKTNWDAFKILIFVRFFVFFWNTVSITLIWLQDRNLFQWNLRASDLVRFTFSVAYVGTEVLFRCRATGYPAPVISWRKGAVPVSSLDSERIQILKNGDLRIIDIKQKDNDVYSCFATNWVGPMHTVEARLAVIVPVSISVSPKNKTVSPGEDVKITCKSGGVPSPIVEWYKDNSLITKQGRVRVSRTDVVISQVQPSDSGYYQCSGRNNYSGASDQMYLNVVKREGTYGLRDVIFLINLCC